MAERRTVGRTGSYRKRPAWRLRWTLSPVGELLVVYNRNMQDRLGRLRLAANELLVKAQYALPY